MRISDWSSDVCSSDLFAFMRRALFGGVALACSAGPLGVFLILRRMSLIGDAIAHGILPGAALAFWLFGLSLPALTAGGLAAGLGMAGAAAWVSRRTGLREEDRKSTSLNSSH